MIDTLKTDKQALVDALTQAGAKFKGNSCNCPFHEDNRPSAGIYQESGGHYKYKCHSCGFNGDIFDIEARNQGKPLTEVLKGHSSEHRAVKTNSGRTFKSIDELKAACPGEIEAVYKYTNPDTGQADMIVLRSRTDTGKTFRQARPVKGGFEMKAPPKPWPIYNRTRIKQADTVVLIEGEKCVHALQEHAITATTNPGGAGKAGHADWQPLAGKNVILWPDNDTPGRRHMAEIEQILNQIEPKPRISTLEPAELDLANKEDVADYIDQCRAAGLDTAQALTEAIQRARPKTAAAGVGQRIEDIIEGKVTAVGLPWPDIARLTNALMPGKIVLVCGGPGASKSFMILQAVRYWQDTGTKACIYELEEDQEFWLMRLLAQRAALPGLTDPDWIQANPEQARAEYCEHKDFLDSVSLWTCPDSMPTLDQVADWIGQRAKQGFRIICVDPVTAAAQSAKPWIDDLNFIQRTKRIATDYGASIILVTHPAKTIITTPDMNTLAGGAAYSRFSQTILWLKNLQGETITSTVRTDCGRADFQHNRVIHILKSNNGKGQGLQIAADFDPESLTIHELGIITKG